MKIAILGYGRMGKTIERIAKERGHHIVLKIGKDNVDELSAESIKKADVAIDFSLPETAFTNISLCINNAVPIVSGTTGWLDRYAEAVDLCQQKEGAFFYASNFSIGVNLFRNINERLAELMNEHNMYDVSMDETHHIHKLDAPSGTAITLAEDILNKIERKKGYAPLENASDQELAIKSIRTGEVPGTHSVRYSSKIDEITIEHRAKGREGFAMGAVIAAEWLASKIGVYGMRDLLKI